jgi:hypothetical protein
MQPDALAMLTVCFLELRKEGVGVCTEFSDNQCLISERTSILPTCGSLAGELVKNTNIKYVFCGYVHSSCNETDDMIAKLGRTKGWKNEGFALLHCQCLGHQIKYHVNLRVESAKKKGNDFFQQTELKREQVWRLD